MRVKVAQLLGEQKLDRFFQNFVHCVDSLKSGNFIKRRASCADAVKPVTDARLSGRAPETSAAARELVSPRAVKPRTGTKRRGVRMENERPSRISGVRCSVSQVAWCDRCVRGRVIAGAK